MAEQQNGGLFVWLQDNARIILSIALVLFLLFAVYNYSQDRTDSISHTENNEENDKSQSSEESKNVSEIAKETEESSKTEKNATEESSEETVEVVTEAETTEEKEKEVSNKPSEDTSSEVTKISLSESNDTIGAKTEEPKEEKTETKEPVITEKEAKITGKGPNVVYNDNDITVSAMRGDGLTHLARRATAEYLNHNNISDLNAGQKIYIEDYVRRSIATRRIQPGTMIVFKHDAFTAGIEKAKSLTEIQKQNLSRYATKAGI